MEKAMNDLLFDCEIADSGLLPRTFWVPATATEPRCCLEKLALDVFHHHVPSNENSNHGNNNNNFYYDPATSGAEWWVQLRPSPPAGRFAMLDADVGMAKSGVSFHWDKDEDLRLMCGGSMYISSAYIYGDVSYGFGCPDHGADEESGCDDGAVRARDE